MNERHETSWTGRTWSARSGRSSRQSPFQEFGEGGKQISTAINTIQHQWNSSRRVSTESNRPTLHSSLTYLYTDLPQSEGWLPKWQLVVASLALFNTAQNFATTALTKRVYSNSPSDGEIYLYLALPRSPSHSRRTVTSLQSRTFGVWTLTSAMVRLYCAYHISDPTYVYSITRLRLSV